MVIFISIYFLAHFPLWPGQLIRFRSYSKLMLGKPRGISVPNLRPRTLPVCPIEGQKIQTTAPNLAMIGTSYFYFYFFCYGSFFCDVIFSLRPATSRQVPEIQCPRRGSMDHVTSTQDK